MNRFSHVDLAAPPFPPPAGGQGGVYARHSRRALRPPLSPPPCGGGRGAIASCARQRSPRAAQARPPLSPPCRGGQGGRAQIMDERRKDPGLQPAPGLLIDGAPRRTAAERWASCARALPCDALSLPKRGRCNRPPPFPPPACGGERGGRSAWLRCGASSVMKVMEGATKARSSSLTSLG